MPIHKAGRERLSHIKGFGGGLLSSEQPKSLYSECTEILDNFKHILKCSDKFSSKLELKKWKLERSFKEHIERDEFQAPDPLPSTQKDCFWLAPHLWSSSWIQLLGDMHLHWCKLVDAWKNLPSSWEPTCWQSLDCAQLTCTGLHVSLDLSSSQPPPLPGGHHDQPQLSLLLHVASGEEVARLEARRRGGEMGREGRRRPREKAEEI